MNNYATEARRRGRSLLVVEGDHEKNEWTDIDLPFVISKKKNLENLCYKNDFTNIILVFDYERHDPQFSADKILRLQNYFSDANFRLIA